MVHFTDRRFSKAGTFLYTIREIKGDDDLMIYDDTVYRVSITTTASGGELSASVDYVRDGIPYAGDVEFVNYSKLPKTGDEHLRLPLILVALSLLAFGGAVIVKKKQARKK